MGPAVLCPEAFPQDSKGWEPVHCSALPMSFSKKSDFFLCGTSGGCPFGPYAGLDNDEPGEQCGRVLRQHLTRPAVVRCQSGDQS